MASLLTELLHDASRRGEEIAEELKRLQGEVSGDVETYRRRMLQLAERAKALVASIMADPDLEDRVYATSYFRDYKHVARLMQELENLPLLVLRRFTKQDQTVTSLMAAICREVGFPHRAPICSSISSQYYWTVVEMDLVFVPCLEPEHLLGLPDGYHGWGISCFFATRGGWSIRRWRSWTDGTTRRSLAESSSTGRTHRSMRWTDSGTSGGVPGCLSLERI